MGYSATEYPRKDAAQRLHAGGAMRTRCAGAGPILLVDQAGIPMSTSRTLPDEAIVELANGGGAPTPPIRATLVGRARSDFALDGCIDDGLAAGARGKLPVRFQPTGARGDRLAALLLDADGGGIRTVVLAGRSLLDASLALANDTLTIGATSQGSTRASTVTAARARERSRSARRTRAASPSALADSPADLP
jgi:hypothetical protein